MRDLAQEFKDYWNALGNEPVKPKTTMVAVQVVHTHVEGLADALRALADEVDAGKRDGLELSTDSLEKVRAYGYKFMMNEIA